MQVIVSSEWEILISNTHRGQERKRRLFTGWQAREAGNERTGAGGAY